MYRILDGWWKMIVVTTCLAFLGQNSTTFATKMVLGIIPLSVVVGLLGLLWAIVPMLSYIKDTIKEIEIRKEKK